MNNHRPRSRAPTTAATFLAIAALLGTPGDSDAACRCAVKCSNRQTIHVASWVNTLHGCLWTNYCTFSDRGRYEYSYFSCDNGFLRGCDRQRGCYSVY